MGDGADADLEQAVGQSTIEEIAEGPAAAAPTDDAAPTDGQEQNGQRHEEPPIEPEPSGVEDDLAAGLADLNARLEESQRLQAHQADLIDRLHSENQQLKAGELRHAQLPLVRDLLRLHDDISRMREAAGGSDGDLRVVQESLLDTLSRNGIESYTPACGDPFDPRLHSAAGIEPTQEEALDKVVADVTKQGFRWASGETIRVAEVRAYRYRATD